MDSRGQLTVFGATVLELMARRGIRNWSTLSTLLEEHNYNFKPSRISNWAYGRHAVDPEFGRALAVVLDLDTSARGELAEAFLFGQREKVNGAELATSSSC